MFKSRSVTIGLLLMVLALFVGAEHPVLAAAAGPVQVSVHAAQSTASWDDRLRDPTPFDLPLLYLHHAREATPPVERTLTLFISGSVGGREIEVELLSWHTNVVTGERHRITKRLPLHSRTCTTDDPCTINWTLDPETVYSDFYTLRVRDEAGDLLWENAHQDRPDLVVLDRWDANIDVYTVRVTYATLFPFVQDKTDLQARLPPDGVTDFIADRFIPLILDTWHTQFYGWGFGPIHPGWDTDKMVEIFITTPPFALFDGTGIYTVSRYADGSPYPERRLWWFSSSPAYDVYDSLETGYRALFSHEFFHMVQWNSLLSAGCSTDMWNNMFIEAQGKFVPSVQYPEFEILGEHVAGVNSEYQSAARHFLAHSLNASYGDLEADRSDRYDWALYWRFLYEQFGGMGIVRASLEEMACRYDPDIEATLPAVMDAAMARLNGPFATFEESLIAFAEANYALRLENGHCTARNPDECENKYYDPNHTYKSPPLENEMFYSGSPLTYGGTIPAGFGMDFVEISLDHDLTDQPLRLTFQGEGRFSVQIWELGGGSGANTHALALASGTSSKIEQSRALTLHPSPIEKNDEGLYVEWIPNLDPLTYDRLALIIVRLDADKSTASPGKYTIRLDVTPDDADQVAFSSKDVLNS